MSDEKSSVQSPQVRAQTDRPTRSKRVPFGVSKQKLGVGLDIPGYHLYWVNDTPGRVSEAQKGGYEFVAPKEVGEVSDGSQVKRLVGTNEDGSAMYAYLMKIEDAYYLEDQATMQKEIDKFDTAINRGTLDEKPGDKRYNAGISIKHS